MTAGRGRPRPGERVAFEWGATIRIAKKLLEVVATGCFAAAADADVISVPNSGFEDPNLGSGTYAYAYASKQAINNLVGGPPGSPAWPTSSETMAFSATAGIAANGSLFDLTDAPNGNSDGRVSTAGQAGFVQTYNGSNGIISIVVNVPDGSAGVGALSFLQEPRASGGAGGLIVLDGGKGIADETPYAGETLRSPAVVESLGNLTAGSHVISFAADAVGPGTDLTTFIDDVSVTTVPSPEPTSLLAAGAASVAYLGFARCRRPVRR